MQKQKITKNTLIWLWKMSGKSKIGIFLMTIFNCSVGFTAVLSAYIFREVVDSAVSKNWDTFYMSCIFFAILTLFSITINAVNRYLSELLLSSLENSFKISLFEKIIGKDYSSVKSVHTGEWMNRLTSDSVIVSSGLVTIIPDVLGMIVKLICAIYVMSILVPKSMWIIIPAGLLILIISYSFRKILKTMHKDVQKNDGWLRIFLTEHLSNLVIVKAFVRENEICGSARHRMEVHKKSRLKRNWFSNFCNTGLSLSFNIAYVFCIVYCCLGIINETVSYGTLVAILQLVNQISSPFMNISGYLPKYYATIASAERLMEIDSFKSDFHKEFLSQDQIQDFYNNSFSSINLKNLSFKYKSNNDKVLDDFNLKINKGDFIALTGRSGIGKSTLLNILMSLYVPDSGELYFITKDNGRVDLDATYRRMFAYVPQGNYLLSGTIRDAVSFDLSMDDDFIWNCLKIACADNFVKGLPDGLDSVLGEKGAGLSEGQIQRIAIARAIASNCPILLFDECTSSLDANTEAKLLDNLKSLTDKTLIVVTHRKKALEYCDSQIDM